MKKKQSVLVNKKQRFFYYKGFLTKYSTMFFAAAVSTDSLASKGSSFGSQEDVSMYFDEEEEMENNRFNALVARYLSN